MLTPTSWSGWWTPCGWPARWSGPAAYPVAHLTGDKAYSSRANRAALRARRIRHTIPERDDQKANRARRGARGGRPPAFDRKRYRQCNQVERLMNRRKQFRAVATRFDKLAVRYQATIAVADIFIWLRARPTDPVAIQETRPSSRRQFGPETHEETEHRYEVKSSDDADYLEGTDSTETQDGQDQLRRSDRGGI
jgi:transposase